VRSVSKAFRGSLVSTLGAGEAPGIHDETAGATLRRINDRETIQTFSLIDSLHLDDAQQIASVYQLVRSTYRKANAFGSLAKDSDEYPHYQPANIMAFLSAVGLNVFLDAPTSITTEALFKLRLNEHFALLVAEYYRCQTDRDLAELFKLLNQYRVSGKVRSMLKQSPQTAVAMLFEMLNQAEIGSKALNKGAEQLAKVAMGDAFDEIFTQRCYRMFTAVDALRKDLKRITQAA
jgi:hypothetical protein